MRKLLLVIAICAGVIGAWSCTKNDHLTNSTEQFSGSVNLKFEKGSSPAGVVTIAAILTRSGYSSVSGQLNITSSSSAEILMANIVPGMWHLKVNASDGNSVILYSGETDINVLANATTIADLQLVPTGKLNVKVTWMIPTNFSDNLTNPIFGKNNSINSPNQGTASAFVLYDDGKYKMWYANMYDSRRYDVNYAESSDGISFATKTTIPVLSPGSGMAWDSYSVYPGAIIKENSTYKMYYVGVTSTNGDSYVGLATSTDGINWVKNSNPPLMALNRRMAVNTVLSYGGKYYMYYNYTNTIPNISGIGLATSTDGLTWTTVTDNLIVNDQSWETSGLISPCVSYDGNRFIMIYGNLSNNGFGLAFSSDGISWTKSSQNPIFAPANTVWSSQVRYPYLLKINDKYRLYYTGYSGTLLAIAYADGTIN